MVVGTRVARAQRRLPRKERRRRAHIGITIAVSAPAAVRGVQIVLGTEVINEPKSRTGW